MVMSDVRLSHGKDEEKITNMTKQPPTVSSIGIDTGDELAVKQEVVPKTVESATTYPEPMIIDSEDG